MTDQVVTTETQVVEEQTIETTQESIFETLVGEGKRYSDPDALAKGKLKGDEFITQLQSELAELREELAKQDHAKDLLDTLLKKETNKVTTTEIEPTELEENTNSSKAVDTLDIESMVEKALAKRLNVQSRESNSRSVIEAMRARYEGNAADVLKAKADELETTVEALSELGANNPKMFYRLMDIKTDTQAKPNTSVPAKGNVNTANLGNDRVSTDRDWAFYENMRKTNRREYFKPATQLALMKDAERLGSAFGKPTRS